MANEYVVSQDSKNKEVYYCHKRGFEYIPVFGSIGDKEKAKAICKLVNHDGKVRYT